MPGVDTASTPVDIAMPYDMDVSGLTALLFGESAGRSLVGSEIIVAQELSLASLYEASSAWIHYIQDASENNFRALINQVKASALYSDMASCVNLTAGSTYSATSQTGAIALELDPSGCAPFSGFGGIWDKYHSLQDMVVSYFATKILGHPGALAAISNDAVLRAAATAAVQTGLEQIYGDESVACVDASGLTNFASKAAANTAAAYNHSYDDGTPNVMTEEDCKNILEQMMNEDPHRFQDQDKNLWQPLRWVTNDVLRFQLNFKGNKYNVKPAGTSSLITGGTSVDMPGEGNTTVQYQLVFTVGA